MSVASTKSYYKHLERSRERCKEASRRRRESDPEGMRAYARRWAQENRDRVNALKRARRAKKPDKKQPPNKERNRAYYEAHKAQWRANYRAWYAKNRDQEIERANVRRAKRLKAMPAWANRDAIRVLYAEARRLTDETGVKHHVDHAIPLQGERVCGLHWEGNLQVLTAVDNLRKGNTCQSQ